MSDQSWYPSNYYIQPHYATFPTITLADTTNLLGGAAKFWRAARDGAVAEWYQAGVLFDVFDSVEPYECGVVTLAIGETQGQGGMAGFEYPPCANGCSECAWVHVSQDTFDRAYYSGFRARLRYVIAHELGHTLGFGHNPRRGVMQSTSTRSPRISGEEIAALKAYWGL